MSNVNFKNLSREMDEASSWGNSFILFIVLMMLIVAGFWSNYAELDSVTRGDGRIISSMQNQTVQAGEGGIILRRYVSENSSVSKGDLLFEIDPIDASSELNQTIKRLNGLQIREHRLRAEIAEKKQFTAPRELAVKNPNIALSQESLFTARRMELLGQIAVSEQRLAQSEQDAIAGSVTLESAAKTMELLEQEIDVVEPLVLQNIAPATELLKLRRELEMARGSRESARVIVEKSRLVRKEINREIDNIHSDYRLTALDELAQVVAQKSELSEALPRLKDRVSRTLIRAPMGGVVNTLKFHTQGGYVRTGDVVLDIVPTGEALIVEAKILPQDISRIKTGDDVRIRLSAYESQKYGHVAGRVERISPDAVVSESGNVSHYLVNVGLEGTIFIEGEPVKIIPGMTASVDVLSGKRTVFEYFWNPLARVRELALRD